MDRVKEAVSLFKQGFSCAQAILATYGKDFGLDEKDCLRAAGGFGAGMGRMGETCGAVTGAFMVIGLKHGKTTAGDDEAKERAYSLVNEFVKGFKDRNKTIVCRELLGHDISKPEVLKMVQEKDLIDEICPKFVRDAAEILEEMLSRSRKMGD